MSARGAPSPITGLRSGPDASPDLPAGRRIRLRPPSFRVKLRRHDLTALRWLSHRVSTAGNYCAAAQSLACCSCRSARRRGLGSGLIGPSGLMRRAHRIRCEGRCYTCLLRALAAPPDGFYRTDVEFGSGPNRSRQLSCRADRTGAGEKFAGAGLVEVTAASD
jgi:hypothetical protein